MNTLLVPLDFSETSINALRFALRMAAPYGATVKLLHVQGIPMTDPYAEQATAEVDAMLEERLHQRLQNLMVQIAAESDEYNKLVDQVPVDSVVRTGFAAGEISRLAGEESADWIVMGTRGAGGISGALFGSVTAAVVGRAERPVLAIPEGAKSRPIRHIACAIEAPLDGGPILRSLDELAIRHKADLAFIHVVEERDVAISGTTTHTLAAFKAMESDVSASAKALSGQDVEETLTQYCEENDVDLLVMVREKHPFLQKLIHRSMTRRLAMHASIPLLVFPPQA
jgi:nucleotide-binding universal stress UspA family protein